MTISPEDQKRIFELIEQLRSEASGRWEGRERVILEKIGRFSRQLAAHVQKIIEKGRTLD